MTENGRNNSDYAPRAETTFQSRVLRMVPSMSRALSLGLAAVLTGMVLFVFPSNLDLLEERLGALAWTTAPDITDENRIVIVAIDERSIAEVGPWPWPRSKMAELTTAIDRAGAQLQVHDVVYSDPKQGDDVLVEALAAARGSVISQVPVLPKNASGQRSQQIQVGQISYPVAGINCSETSAPGVLSFPSTNSYLAPHNQFSGVPRGHIAPLVSADGSINKQPAVVCVGGLPYPALSISTLLVATSAGGNAGSFASEVSVNTGDSFWAPPYELSIKSYPGLSIPLDAEGNLRVSYSKAPESYFAVSAVDILNGGEGTDLLNNAWALIGATAFGLGDVVPTPFAGVAPGVELQARILGSVLDENVPYTPRASNALLVLMSVVFGLLLMRLAAAPGRVAVFGVAAAALLLPVLALGLHGLALSVFSIWLGWVAPSIFSFFAAALIALLEQFRVRSQRNRVLGNLESYLPSRLAEQIAYSLPSSSINASRQNVTLLTADIRNFSAFSEAFPPEDTAAVLHFFFTKATQIIESNGGRLHEFRGDGLLAIWEGHGSEAAKSAFAAGQEMHEGINGELLQTITPRGFEALAIGIGIEQGPALIGSIGPAHRRTHALLGDTVTIALRIQEMTSDLAQPLLLGECVARQLGDIKLQSQGSYLLAGLTNPHVLYAPAPIKSAAKVERDGPRLTVVSGGR